MFAARHFQRVFWLVSLMVVVAGPGLAARRPTVTPGGDAPSRVVAFPGEIIWEPLRDFEGATLILSGPDGEITRKEFGPGAAPSFTLAGLETAPKDGRYLWEVRFIPRLVPLAREALRAAAENNDPERTALLNRIYGIHHDQLVQAGQFSIREGRIEADVDDEATGDEALAARRPSLVPGPRGPLAAYDVSGNWTLTGDLGVGTDTPSQELDIVDSSPVIQMEDSSSSFSWFVNGNDGGFDIRRQSNSTGDRVFYLDPSAPQPSIWVDSAGRWGNGTSVPTAPLHVLRTDGTSRVRVEDTGSPIAIRSLFEMVNNGGVGFEMVDSRLGAQSWQFRTNLSGNFSINNVGDPSGGTEFTMAKDTGDLTLEGDVIANGILLTSDRDAKENLEPVDAQDILARVVRLPISRWNLKNRPKAPHIGPTAQDVHEILEVGDDERRISPIDTAGASLAAVQGLYELVRHEIDAQREEISGLREVVKAQREENRSLRERLAALEKLAASIARADR